MLSAESKEAIRVLCPDVHPDVVDDFFTRMDEDYFATFSADEIASHIRMSARLDSNQRLHVRIQPNSVASSDFDITIVGLDYLSEFSMFCGLLSALAWIYAPATSSRFLLAKRAVLRLGKSWMPSM